MERCTRSRDEAVQVSMAECCLDNKWALSRWLPQRFSTMAPGEVVFCNPIDQKCSSLGGILFEEGNTCCGCPLAFFVGSHQSVSLSWIELYWQSTRRSRCMPPHPSRRCGWHRLANHVAPNTCHHQLLSLPTHSVLRSNIHPSLFVLNQSRTICSTWTIPFPLLDQSHALLHSCSLSHLSRPFTCIHFPCVGSRAQSGERCGVHVDRSRGPLRVSEHHHQRRRPPRV